MLVVSFGLFISFHIHFFKSKYNLEVTDHLFANECVLGDVAHEASLDLQTTLGSTAEARLSVPISHARRTAALIRFGNLAEEAGQLPMMAASVLEMPPETDAEELEEESPRVMRRPAAAKAQPKAKAKTKATHMAELSAMAKAKAKAAVRALAKSSAQSKAAAKQKAAAAPKRRAPAKRSSAPRDESDGEHGSSQQDGESHLPPQAWISLCIFQLLQYSPPPISSNNFALALL